MKHHNPHSMETQLGDPIDPLFETATEVSDYLLEITRQHYLARDEVSFAARFLLPQVIGTFDGDRMLTSVEDVKQAFRGMLREIDRHSTVDIVRRTLSARFLSPNEVQASFASRYLLEDDRLGEEIFALGRLVLVDGRWMIAESRYATSDKLDISGAIGVTRQSAAPVATHKQTKPDDM